MVLSKSSAAAAVLLVVFSAALVKAQDQGCSLSIQFDNSKKSVSARETANKIMKTLADKVFLVPADQVTVAGGLDEGGFLSTRATLTYYAVGPTKNGKDVCANCKENVSSRMLGLRDSVLEAEINSATDTWWPGDSVDVDRAECQVA